jgi:ABC-type amino acid transport substrate-binding protein
LLRLPSDLFELFTVSGVVNSHLGSMAAAMHAAALSLLVAAAMLGQLHVSVRHLVRFGIVSAAIVAVFLTGTRALYTWLLPPRPSGLETLAPLALREPLATTVVTTDGPVTPPRKGERLKEIESRGVLRVGYFPDQVPWSFVNAAGTLVGYDVEAAHRLAGDLGVKLEFVQSPRESIADALTAGQIDIVMAGLTGVVSRAQRMELTQPYSTERVGFLVRDYRRDRFASLDTLTNGTGLTILVPKIKEAHDLGATLLSQATILDYVDVADAVRDTRADAVLMPVERAYYWSHVRPEFTAIHPQGLNIAVITVYAVPYGESEFRNLVDLWIETRRASGALDEAYGYWIKGQALRPPTRRWSLVRDVFGWR